MEVFLSGDFKFLDACLGHHGSSASFSSAKDLVSLDHLRNHGGKCIFPILHITLGIVLKLFNMVLQECKKLDYDVSCTARVEEIEKKWKTYSHNLLKECEKLRDFGPRFIDYKNF